MEYVFLGIFFVATAIHLYARLNKKARLRDISKVCIVAPLILLYVFSVDEINIFVVLALIACWIGDILLVMHGVKWFVLGGISFWIAHACFIVAYNYEINYELIPLWVLIVIPVIMVCSMSVVLYKLKPYVKKPLFIPTCGYLLFNGSMNVFAIFRLVTGIALSTSIGPAYIGPLFTVIGALLFLVSDSTLFFARFNKNSIMHTHFLVMLTYSLGELLIVLGLIIGH